MTELEADFDIYRHPETGFDPVSSQRLSSLDLTSKIVGPGSQAWLTPSSNMKACMIGRKNRFREPSYE
jgi:hypothetical protein